MTDLSDKLHKVYPFAALSQQISVIITDSFDANLEIVSGSVWEVQVMKRLLKEKQITLLLTGTRYQKRC